MSFKVNLKGLQRDVINCVELDKIPVQLKDFVVATCVYPNNPEVNVSVHGTDKDDGSVSVSISIKRA